MGSISQNVFPGTALPDWSNLAILHRNTLDPHAIFYSYSSEKAAMSFDREQSEYMSLNGTWNFHYDASPFLAPDWDQDDTTWVDIEVPGPIQMQGYGHPHYTNIKYPFQVNPPNVSYMNPTASYWREVDIPSDWDGQQIRLHYSGVESAFHVYVNGDEVGYSQGARNPHEFDITEYVTPGESNTLATRVYQWHDGSYIEDQDQWWLSGIFRDVYLAPVPKSAIADFHVLPTVDDSFKTGVLAINVTIQGDHGDLNVTVLKPDGDTLEEWNGHSADHFSLDVGNDDLLLWSAESPDLYTVLLTFNGRTISQRFGFSRIEFDDQNFLVNGKPIILYGVNRHEHNHLSGRTVPYEAMKADLIRMKRSNINAIRTAHQPPHPDFFDLADELGFYVIAEADVECHGFTLVSGDENAASQWTSDNPEWREAYLDRAVHLVESFKNHASVVFWSLGNECQWGQNFEAMYNWIKERDPAHPVHYEQDRGAKVVDMHSRMYDSPDAMVEFLEEHEDGKPLIMCEFAHAMGNGPGALKEYVDLFRDHPRIQGGFVWEWSNHGLLKKEGDLEYFAYGGDFGDEPNDADFIMDGLVLSDHTPMPSLYEYAKVISPVSARLSPNSSQHMIIENHYGFLSLDGVDAEWHLVTDGDVTEPKALELPHIPAGQERSISLPLGNSSISEEKWLIVEFKLKDKTQWAAAGHVVGWDQLYLGNPSSNRIRPAPAFSKISPRDLKIKQQKSSLKVQNSGATIGFDLLQGNVTWQINGVDLFQRGPELSFYRALTQNDVPGDGVAWEEAWLGSLYSQVREATWREVDEGLEVTYKVRVGPKVLEWAAEAKLVYTVLADKPMIRVEVSGDFVGENTPEILPRIGLAAVMPAEFDQVAWFGRGPGENYKDSKEACRFGNYESSVKDLFTYYDYPQENGNREDLRWLRISDGSVELDVRRVDETGFAFTARNYGPFDLNDATHPHELEPLDATFLNLDYDTHGVGSATVGPTPLDKHTCYAKPFHFVFELSVI